MSRTPLEVERRPASFEPPNKVAEVRQKSNRWEFWAVRALLVVGAVVLTRSLAPFGLREPAAVGAGFLAAMLILLAELRLRRAAMSGLVGGALGAVIGVAAAVMVVSVISHTSESEPTKSYLEFGSLIGFSYLGMMIGAEKGAAFRWPEVGNLLPASKLPAEQLPPGKLLDTSVLIDGRIADICEAHFLDGPLLVPQFVLHELQLIADSADGLRRQRGRRGLEVLQRIQKMAWLGVRVIDEEAGSASDVDHKLVEVAKRTGAKIVTNDFNLNKVASVQGIDVLNVNLLANALRPVVLPGESMRVLILREGKEANQGVAYLEDGTMVVVDGGRRHINKTVETIVTSVHQTPAGKMIFGRLEERNDDSSPRQMAAGAGKSGPTVVDRGSRLPKGDVD